VEPSLFKLRRGDRVLHLLVFVDDLRQQRTMTTDGPTQSRLLTANFEMTDMGRRLKYLGWHITREREKGEMWISLRAISTGRNRIPTTRCNSYIQHLYLQTGRRSTLMRQIKPTPRGSHLLTPKTHTVNYYPLRNILTIDKE